MKIATLSVLLLAALAGCTTLDVETDPARAPTRLESMAWLNAYFEEHDFDFEVTDKWFVYRATRADAHEHRVSNRGAACPYKDVRAEYVNGKILIMIGVLNEAGRFDVADQTEAAEVMQRLMVLGVKYNKKKRMMPFGCLNGQQWRCPKYPDEPG